MTFDTFVESHIHLAKRAVTLMARRYSRFLTADEIYSAACYGLVRAARKFKDKVPADEFPRVAMRTMMRAVTDDARREMRSSRIEAVPTDMIQNRPDRRSGPPVSLDGLCPLDRQIVRMLIDGKSHQEIAVATDITAWRLKVSLSRIAGTLHSPEDSVDRKRVA